MMQVRTLLQKELYIFLLPIFFVLHGFVTNYPAVPAKDAAIVLIRYSVIILVAVFVFFLLFKRFHKAAWFTFWLFTFQFFFGPLHDGLKGMAPNAFFSKHTFLFFVILITFIVFFLRLRKRITVPYTFLRFVNILLLTWVVIDIVKLAVTVNIEVREASSQKITSDPCPSCPRPDVYFIIADEYAGSTALNHVFGFDNTAFEDSLRARGFHIIPNSTSNYNYTPYSIASILSMKYLSGITSRSNDIANLTNAYKSINENDLTHFFRSLDYEFYNFSPFDFAGKPTMVNTQFFKTREKLITGQTYTNRLERDLSFNVVTRFKIKPLLKAWSKHTWNINQKMYEETIAIAGKKSEQPKFVYTHLFMPHYPYYFNEHGQPFPLESLMEGEQGNKRNYIAYLQFSNKRFLNLVDEIVKKSVRPPLIIFMGDHGFRHLDASIDQKHHFSNINAVLFPVRHSGESYSGMSAVNQFRIVLNKQFNQKLPLLKDSTWFLREY